MRNAAILLGALFVTPLFADVHVVLPGCCTSILWSLSVVDGATGRVQHEFTSPAIPGWGYAEDLAITKSGTQAAVLENLYPNNGPQAITVEFMNLDTGNTVGSVTTQSALGSSIVTDPVSGMLYVVYLSDNGGIRMQSINPATLSVVVDVGTGCEGNAVIPAGRVIFCTTFSGIAVLDSATLTQIGEETASGGVSYLALSADRSTLYTGTGAENGEVDFLDTATLAITQTFSLGATIWGMAVSPDGSVLYLGTSNLLDMLNTSTLGLTSVPAPAWRPDRAGVPERNPLLGVRQRCHGIRSFHRNGGSRLSGPGRRTYPGFHNRADALWRRRVDGRRHRIRSIAEDSCNSPGQRSRHRRL